MIFKILQRRPQQLIFKHRVLTLESRPVLAPRSNIGLDEAVLAEKNLLSALAKNSTFKGSEKQILSPFFKRQPQQQVICLLLSLD